MAWQHGLNRVKLVGTVSLVAGAILLAIQVGTRLLGYAPDPAFVSLYALLWPGGLALMILGALLWIAAWILQGFDPGHAVPPAPATYAGSAPSRMPADRGPDDLPRPRGTFQP